MSLADVALRAIRRHHMLPRGGRVLAAVSGGADSVALLHLLLELQGAGELEVAGVVHLNHQLRGADADGDEQFCRELAAHHSLPFEAAREDVRTRAGVEKRSIEDTARRARYEFFADAATRAGAVAVAVGHTHDDQAETFLLRLLRGAGSRGLAGIRPKAGLIIRPLIDIRRLDLREYVQACGLLFREDATNADVTIPRNRVRHELIPYLERSFNPGVVDTLVREAASAREDEEKLHAEAIDLTTSIVLTNAARTAHHVDAAALNALHPAIAARVAREALARLGSDRFIGFDHIQRFLEFVAHAREGAALSLPGQQVVRQGPWVVIGPEPLRRAREAVSPKPLRGVAGSGEGRRADFRFPLSIPGEVVLDKQGLAVSAAWESEFAGSIPAGLACVVAGATLPLAVRSRRPGDRFEPPGLGGRSKKLQDYLVDRKVARGERDLLPLVVDGDDRIVWIVGHAVSEDFRAVTPSTGVIFLKARHLGGEV